MKQMLGFVLLAMMLVTARAQMPGTAGGGSFFDVLFPLFALNAGGYENAALPLAFTLAQHDPMMMQMLPLTLYTSGHMSDHLSRIMLLYTMMNNAGSMGGATPPVY